MYNRRADYKQVMCLKADIQGDILDIIKKDYHPWKVLTYNPEHNQEKSIMQEIKQLQENIEKQEGVVAQILEKLDKKHKSIER